MNRLKSILIIISILCSYLIISGCGKSHNPNMDKYFTKSDSFVKVVNDLKIEIKELFVNKEPSFYKPSIYKEKKELFLIKELEYGKEFFFYKLFPSIFGWNGGFMKLNKDGTISLNMNTEEKKTLSIIMDETKYLKDFKSTRIFDVNNSLSYGMYKDGTMRCYKLTNAEEKESWRIKLPFNSKLTQISNRALNDCIVVYCSNDIIIIDTKKVEIKAIYHSNKAGYICDIIPFNNKLWIFTPGNPFHVGDSLLINFKVDVIDTNYGYDSSFIFNNLINMAKINNDSIVLSKGNEVFIIEDNFNVRQFKISDFHKDTDNYFANIDNKSVQLDSLSFMIKDKKYILNIDNPSELNEVPKNLEVINQEMRVVDWDYYYLENGYCYGYDINKHETTWKIKTNERPIFSSEFGIMFNDISKRKILVFGVK